jgi:hypothetical protein
LYAAINDALLGPSQGESLAAEFRTRFVPFTHSSVFDIIRRPPRNLNLESNSDFMTAACDALVATARPFSDPGQCIILQLQ